MDRVLEVSAEAVARYWDVHPVSVRRACEAGLVRRVGNRLDAEHVLELGRRPYVDPTHLTPFAARSILLVQHSPWTESEPDKGWREDLDADQRLRNASGYWPMDARVKLGVRGIVATLASFVVTVAIVNADNPVAERLDNGRVLFNSAWAEEDTLIGIAMLRAFRGRRIPIQPGSSFLIPPLRDAVPSALDAGEGDRPAPSG